MRALRTTLGTPETRRRRPRFAVAAAKGLRAFVVFAAIGLGTLGCEGQGDRGDGLVIRNEPSGSCAAAVGRFPSGLAVLSEDAARATLVQFAPPGLSVYGLDAEVPAPLAFVNVGGASGSCGDGDRTCNDSDGDGECDRCALERIGLPPFTLAMGEIAALRDDLALVSASNYEEVLVYDPATPAPREVRVEVPPAIPPGRFPLLPAPGTSGLRVGISTLACIEAPGALDSRGDPIPSDPVCDPSDDTFRTTLTAGKTVAGDRLFVATSNLGLGDRFLPGTVLVYDWIEGPAGITVRPAVDTPVLFTSGFNPTGMVRFETPGGRELVLVTVTGAIGATGGGAGNVRTDSAVDVIDPTGPRIVATIPLERAGPSFDRPAVDPTGRVALLGSSSQRRIHAVDLRALDDPALYADSGPPVILDGLTTGFPDARIFSGDRPLEIPARTDRVPPPSCAGFTHVALDARGREAYVTDYCDGTFTRIRLDLTGAPPIPYPTDRFQIAGQTAPFAPIDAIGERRAASLVRTRPGEPGVDYTSPDVLVLTGQPSGGLCALRVASF